MQQKKIKILFFGPNYFDYLSDSILIGLKENENIIVHEYRKNDIIYNKINRNIDVHGKAFTLGGVVDLNKEILYEQGSQDIYDYYIFGSINSQSDLFLKFKSKLKKNNTILIDGFDSPSLFPFYGALFNLDFFKIGFSHFTFNYFKRELILDEIFYTKLNKYIPKILFKFYLRLVKVQPISFSIPRKKIVKIPLKKLKLFPSHIVDTEIIDKIGTGNSKYVFVNEDEYYNDLKISKFCITTKRSGWDCMRHYEIAANGSLICFKNLKSKPKYCAPHGLIDGYNCISYEDYNDLMNRINKITDKEYDFLIKNSLIWVNKYSCENIPKLIFKNKFY